MRDDLSEYNFSLVNSIESREFVEYVCTKWYLNLPPLVYETEILAQHQEDTGNREDL